MTDKQNALAKPGHRNDWLLLALSGIVLVALLSLGTWQIHRLEWKETLQDQIEDRLQREPVSVSPALELVRNGQDIEYLPIAVTGTFEHEFEQFFLATQNGISGWYVYTPLKIASSQHVFVNRGFVPFDNRDASTRRGGQVDGEVTISGLARSAPSSKPSFLVPDNEPAAGTYFWKDLEAMQKAAGLRDVLPFFIDANADPNPGGLPAGGVTIIELPNNHLQYAITWYGLAGALGAVLFVWFWRRKHKGGNS